MKLGIGEGDFQIQFVWDSLKETSPPSLYVCNQNTAFLAINKMPIHLTAMDDDTHPVAITGHSVMMGYLDDGHNEKVLIDGKLKI